MVNKIIQHYSFCVILLILSLFTNIAYGQELESNNISSTNGDDAHQQIPVSTTQSLHSNQILPLINLQVGQYYPINGLSAEKIKNENPEIVEYKSDATGIVIKAKTPGKTKFSIYTNEKVIELPISVSGSYNIEKTNTNTDRFIKELKVYSNLKIIEFGNKHIIEGEVISRIQYQALLKALKFNSNKIISMNTIAPGIKESLIEQSKAALSHDTTLQINIENAGNRFFLEGKVSKASDIERALSLIQPIIANIENHIPIPLPVTDTISIRVFMIELTKHAHELLGLSWPSVVNNAAVISPKNSIFSPSWSIAVKHLATKGFAKVLAEPMISVKNGSSAELSAGGEIPLKIVGKFENKVIWKKYGLNIKIHVNGVSGNFIKTKINTTSSQLDDGTSIEGVPGIRSNHLNTEVDVEENNPILLTGLFQSSSAKDIEKMPVLGDIPIIGELFKSRRFVNRESELLIAILPQFGQYHAQLPLTSKRGLEFDKYWKIND